MGRPSTYSDQTAEAICNRLAHGESLVTICRDPDMPGYRTVMQWLEKNQEFAQNYTRAREQQADHLAEEILEIADQCDDPTKGRLQVDVRKWYAGKLRPKVYGDKVTQEHTGPDGGPIKLDQTTRKARLSALMSIAAERNAAAGG